MTIRNYCFLIVFFFLNLAPLTVSALETWQNPSMSLNPWNNIHNDSWFTDTYPFPGPTEVTGAKVELIWKFTFDDPRTGRERTIRLGNCAAHAYTSKRNLQVVCAGFPNPNTNEFRRSIVQISPDGNLLSYHEFNVPFTSIFDASTAFGGAGYFFQDPEDRVVMGMPDGHVKAWKRVPSPLSEVNMYVPERDINVTGLLGPVPRQIGSFYALLPDEENYIWFTTSEGVVGTIAPEPCQHGCVKWIDVNNPAGDGVSDLMPGNLRQRISEAHAIDRKAMYQQTDFKMYRFDRTADGTPEIAWSMEYDRGNRVKPGQTSQGSGTSPSFFEIGDRKFVTIMDNARRPNILVYRAERRLPPGEGRLLAQGKPFGSNPRISDENSLVVFPGSRPDTMRIYAENNWGNRNVDSTFGPLITRTGFGGIEVAAEGSVKILPQNTQIRVPSVVSKANVNDGLIYTYNKARNGWFLTALDPSDPRRTVWTVRIGWGGTCYNNWYAQLSLAPGGRVIHIGTLCGVLKITPNRQQPTPPTCFLIPEARRFTVDMRELAQWKSGPIQYPDFIKASLLGFTWDILTLRARTKDRIVRKQLWPLIWDIFRSRHILRRADYDVLKLSSRNQRVLQKIADSHDPLLLKLDKLHRKICTVPAL